MCEADNLKIFSAHAICLETTNIIKHPYKTSLEVHEKWHKPTALIRQKEDTLSKIVVKM